MFNWLSKGRKIDPERMIICKRPALLDRYPTCCSCNKKFPDSTEEYYCVVLSLNGVNIPSEPCCKECLSKFTGFPVEEFKQ